MCTLHEYEYTFFSYLAQFFSKWEMFEIKFVDKIKTQILCSIFFFQLCRYEVMWKYIVQLGRPHMTKQYCARALHAGYLIFEYLLIFYSINVCMKAPQCYLILYCLSCLEKKKRIKNFKGTTFGPFKSTISDSNLLLRL